MTWLYAIYSIALGIWTYQSVGKYGVLAHGTYIVLVSILLITGIAVGLVWRKKKVIRDGVFIALILINIGCSLAYRTNTDALYGYFTDTGFMISIFFLVYVVVRYTRIYQNKLLNLIGMMALPVILISTRFVSEPVNGAYIYFFGIQIFGLTLMGYPFVVAEFMSMPEKKYLNRSVRSLSFNLLGDRKSVV